jgi:hypothetical protein
MDNHHTSHIAQAKDRTKNYETIMKILLSLQINPSTIGDWGCGYCSLIAAAQNVFNLSKAHGFDADWIRTDKLLIDRSMFTSVDLSNPSLIPRYECDVAFSVEVGEHLPSECSRPLVKRLTESAPIVIFSAAVPGQRGFGHINLHWQSYWAQIFSSLGYKPYDIFRPNLATSKGIPFWFKQNMFLYASDNFELPSAIKNYRISNHMLDYVHKSFFSPPSA